MMSLEISYIMPLRKSDNKQIKTQTVFEHNNQPDKVGVIHINTSIQWNIFIPTTFDTKTNLYENLR